MVFVVQDAVDLRTKPDSDTYEQPLNERMRTFLRLEFLYRKTEHHLQRDSDLATRQAIDSILEIGAILTRGDVRSEVLKEIERQADQLQTFVNSPGVDTSRLSVLVDELAKQRNSVNALGPHYLQAMKDSEFLSAIKHRSAIPGGTCEFDLPLFSHWLRRSHESRSEDMERWLKDLRPLCVAVSQIMWLIRESAIPKECMADAGMYQHSLDKESNCRMLRVLIRDQAHLFPEISGSPQRFTIRFLQWGDIDSRPIQTQDRVPFVLSFC
ncbi:MAG: cell division protein ZapD [Woeseiaceae bacterium]